MKEILSDNSPYKGLQAYTESDRHFFFGRERDQEIIASNLFAAPLTVFYGASGVGKSSVLLAGVVPKLRESPRVAVVVFRDWQDASFETALKLEIMKAIQADAENAIDLTLDLDEFLLACTKAFRGSLFFILDQFEEYFLYHPASPESEKFDAAFARAINRSEIGANFLLSLRDDGLSRLDRFRKRIPNLLNNMLRLQHLDRRSAELAIIRPLDKYNETISKGQPPVEIEQDLVTVLLDDLITGKVTLDRTGQGKLSIADRADQTGRIETPFLQMVLTRLWDEEKQAWDAEESETPTTTRTLRLATYNALGGATTIVRTHLDKMMATKRLHPHRDTAAALFHFLVTPTGMKIAHTVGDLVSYVKQPEIEVQQALNELSEPDVRILRPVAAPPGQPELLRYEIFHDVLAPAILDWRGRYMKEQADAEARVAAEKALTNERAEAKRIAGEQQRQLELAEARAETERLRAEEQQRLAVIEQRNARVFKFGLAAILLLFLGMVGVTAYAFSQRGEANKQKDEANKQKDAAQQEKVKAKKAQLEAEGATAEALRLKQVADENAADAERAKNNIIEEQKRTKVALSNAQQALNERNQARVETSVERKGRVAAQTQLKMLEDQIAANTAGRVKVLADPTSYGGVAITALDSPDTSSHVAEAPEISSDAVRQIMPNVATVKRDAYLPFLQKAMAEFEINTPIRQAAFLAQIAHESGELRYMEEIASGAAYEGRADLGNTQPGDGKRFKGRGPIQIAGRRSYREYGELLGVDLIDNPKLAATPEVGFRIAGLFWKKKRLNELADNGDIRQMTFRINGGFYGLQDRQKYYERAKQVLGVSSQP